MKKTRFVEEYFIDPSSGQRAIYEALFGKEKKHSSDRTAPCSFFIFPKVKSAIKGTSFESVDVAKAKVTEPDTRSASNTGHGQTNPRVSMKLCVTVEGNPHGNILPDFSSSYWPEMSNKINPVSLLLHPHVWIPL